MNINIAHQAYCQMGYKNCLPGDLSAVTLRLFYDSGKISGYAIFYDQNGQMCAVDFNQIPLLTCGDWKEPLEVIRPEDFMLFTLNNSTDVFAYPIRAIPFPLPENNSIKITFRWGPLEAVDQVGNYTQARLKKDLYQLPILYQDRKFVAN